MVAWARTIWASTQHEARNSLSLREHSCRDLLHEMHLTLYLLASAQLRAYRATQESVHGRSIMIMSSGKVLLRHMSVSGGEHIGRDGPLDRAESAGPGAAEHNEQLQMRPRCSEGYHLSCCGRL